MAASYIDMGSIDSLAEAVGALSDIVNKYEQQQAQLIEEREKRETAMYKRLAELQITLAAESEERTIDLKAQAEEQFIRSREKLVQDALAREEKKRKRLLTDAEIKATRQAIINKYKYDDQVKATYEKKARKKREAEQKEEARKAAETWQKNFNETVFGKGKTIGQRLEAIKGLAVTNADGSTNIGKTAVAGLYAAVNGLADYARQLNNQIDEIALNKSLIDTRLQGSKNNKNWDGSYWEKMSKDIVGAAGASPFVKQADIVNNLKTMVQKGISYNVTQRAFLETIKDKIAATFDANNGVLLRLVRIQQKDTTAARLGMESALNTFLNQMYETTEYMNDVMTNVKGSLEESMALMDAEKAVGFEYQVQKWMGSLYSVGMSSQSTQAIADAFGKLAAGDISALGSGAGNLMVMAANEANLSMADILADGLDDSETNALMRAMVQYLSDLYENSKDSHVVQQQIANVYGVAASDLKAAASLATEATLKTVTYNASNYDESMSQLNSMLSTMGDRISTGEFLSNAFANLKYTMAAGVSNNPVLYGIYKLGGMLKDLTGGIALPAISVMGNMVDLHTTIADLMQVGALSGGIISGIGSMIGGGGGFNMQQALGSLGTSTKMRGDTAYQSETMIDLMAQLESTTKAAGAPGAPGAPGNLFGKTNRKAMLNRGGGSTTTSESGYSNTNQGNSNSSDVIGATQQSASEEGEGQLAAKKEEEGNSVTIETVDEHVVDIYALLSAVVEGTSSFKVRQELSTAPGGFTY